MLVPRLWAFLATIGRATKKTALSVCRLLQGERPVARLQTVPYYHVSFTRFLSHWCFFLDKNWNFKYYLEELPVQGAKAGHTIFFSLFRDAFDCTSIALLLLSLHPFWNLTGDATLVAAEPLIKISRVALFPAHVSRPAHSELPTTTSNSPIDSLAGLLANSTQLHNYKLLSRFRKTISLLI